jgi:hypothetical protein
MKARANKGTFSCNHWTYVPSHDTGNNNFLGCISLSPQGSGGAGGRLIGERRGQWWHSPPWESGRRAGEG